jgi:alpha-N-arabinofuranosidase
MRTADVVVHANELTPLSPYVHGQLVEHLGKCVYDGIWDLERQVPRADVQAALRALGGYIYRYPGGGFADWYHWRDGVGPREERPVHDTQFWSGFSSPGTDPGLGRLLGPVETNSFGTDEFLQYCLDIDAEPMLVANFGSGTPEEAADWVRYCNVDRRSPRPVRWWSVGNEIFGHWEIGHCSGTEYGKRVVEFVEAMRAVDPTILVVGVGEASNGKTWNADVLEQAPDAFDAMSAHFYFPGPSIGRRLRDTEGDFLQVATGADELGPILDSTLAELDAALGPDRKMPLALDEWGLWSHFDDLVHQTDRLADAPIYAGFLNQVYRRADRVTIAMYAQPVNVIGAVQTSGDRMFVTTGYLVQWLYRHASRANAVPVTTRSDTVQVAAFEDLDNAAETAFAAAGLAKPREAAVLDCTATSDESGVTVFLATRTLHDPLQVTVSGLPPQATGRLRWLAAESPWSRNDADHPDAVSFRQREVTTDADGVAVVEVPPHTVAALEVPAG